MRFVILNGAHETEETLDLEPRCGDYCDCCSDCMACSGDECYDGHFCTRVVYSDQAVEFRRERLGEETA